MRHSIFVLALVSLPVAAHAQTVDHPWRFGFELSGPARVLASGPSQINLGIGEGVEALRVLGVKDKLRGVVLVRLNTAPVEGKGAGATWNPGRAFIADVSLRGEHTVGARGDVFAGAGVSHWTGPESVAPFAGASSILYAAELGGSMGFGKGLWRGSLTVHITQFGPDDARDMQSGGVFRVLVGAHRDY